MVRSVGIAAVVAGLAWTGLVAAQSPSPAGTATARPRFIIVSEQGQPQQRCKLIKTWKDANGAPAYQVQAVDTGELMTIVSSAPQGTGGDSREMPTRIFRWGRDNKPPAGTPMPPPDATVLTPPPAPPAAPRVTTMAKPDAAPVIKRQPLRPASVTANPRPATVPQTVQKTDFTPAPTSPKPADSPYILTNKKPTPPVVVSKSNSGSPAKPTSQTPRNTQLVQYLPSPTQGKQVPATSSTTACPSRLVPLAAGTVIDQKSCNCDCSQCNTCSKPCNPCNQSSCVCNTPSPMRQPFIGRLFKSNTPCSNAPCTDTTIVSKPMQPATVKPASTTLPSPAVVKATTEPAKRRDWRESWGKIEPFKTTVHASDIKPAVVATKRVNPTPVPLEPSKQADPLKDPDHYRDLVMNARLSNSKIPQPEQPSASSGPSKVIVPTSNVVAPQQGPVVSVPPAHPVETMTVASVPPPPPNVAMPASPAQGAMPALVPPAQPPIRVVQIAADEANAFWSPKAPSDEQKDKPKNSAFDRVENSAPEGNPQAMTSVPRGPQPMPGVLPTPPRGLMLMNPPRPPSAPYTSPSGPPRPMSPDTGVADSMGNAFTLPGTRRPIPADFGGTPQEPNGFDPPMQMGQGSPPIAYGMGNPGTMRPPMPNMMAMGPRVPMGVNPLMNVPPTPVAWQNAAPASAPAQPANVSQSLATLRESLYPSERETAAEQLSELNWRSQPLVVETLMKVAREDPAATVRAACIHALAHMKADSTAVVTLVRDLKSDRDPRVRQEAEEALNALGESDIRQTSHK